MFKIIWNLISLEKTKIYHFVLHLKDYLLNNKKKDLFILILFIISYFYYFLSLEKCLDGDDVCCAKIKWIQKKIIELIISCLLISFLLHFIILKQITKIHLIHTFFVFSLCYKYSHGYNFNDHGYYNVIGYIFLLIIFSLLIYLFRGIHFAIKNDLKYLVIILFKKKYLIKKRKILLIIIKKVISVLANESTKNGPKLE